MATTLTTPASATQAALDRAEACMINIIARYGIVMARGQGVQLWDAEGKAYLDLFSGFGAGVLGHCHPDLVEAVTRQAKTLWHVGNLIHTEPQVLLAEAIARHGFGGKSFFCHSGADANDAAFKLARLYGRAKPNQAGKPRYKIISTTQSFHGRSFGSMMATGQDKVRDGFQPWLEGFVNVPYNDLAAMTAAVDDLTIGIIVEPIQGEGGINVPSDGYLPGLRKLCDERDLVLIMDEVWTGCGRTGRYFAHQHWNINPDVMTLAKGVGGGLPVGVMCAGPKVSPMFDHKTHGKTVHATTLGGNCLSMAVSTEVFRVMERDDLVNKAARLGDYAMGRLRRFAAGCKRVKDVRGKGLFIGIELDPTAGGTSGGGGGGAWFKNAGDVVMRCLEKGVLINNAQTQVLRLAPPLVVTQADLDRGLDIIEQVIKA